MTDTVVCCDDPLYRCRCVKPTGHADTGDKVHACSETACGGSWEWLDDHTYRVQSYPRPAYEGAVIPPPPSIEDRDGVPFREIPPAATSDTRGGIRFVRTPCEAGTTATVRLPE